MMNIETTSKMSKKSMDGALTSFSSMTKGFQQIAAESTEYSKKSFEDSAAMMEKLVAAKSLDKVIEIQTNYAKSAYEAFVAQATKMSEIYADIAKDAYKPFEAAVAKVGA